MALNDPVAVYNAANNIEATLVCNALLAAEIEAQVIEDDSVVGLSMYGPLAEIHKPQVWIARADIERAGPVLAEFERRASELRASEVNATTPPIEVVCECGVKTAFPASQRGSVQECSACGAYLDVDPPDDGEDWGSPDSEEADEPSE